MKDDDEGSKSMSKPIVRIASLAIILGLTVMIVAVAIVTGFQAEIRNKVIGFGSHIQINKYDFNNSYEASPISKDQPFYPGLENEPGIKHIQVYANKAGIIKTGEEIQGVVVKGIGSDFDWSFFEEKLVEGQSFRVSDSVKSNEIMVSKYIADLLKLNVGDKVNVFFIQDPPRARSFKLTGIYETGLEEYDKIYVYADITHIRKLNDWTDDMVAGFEVTIDRYEDLDKLGARVDELVGYKFLAQTVKQLNAALFDWLGLQDMNVLVILVLMSIVVVINMSTALLIMILERTNMIGTLKALGSSNWSIRKIFLIDAGYIIGKGMIWGNLIGITLCLLQQQFGIIPLDQSSYYLSQVPINLEISHLLILNTATFLISVVVLVLPSYVITSITPVKALRFS